MSVVCALRFDKYSGGICVDEESWYLRNRKTFFNDCLHSLVPEEVAERFGIELAYGGIGHPPFHCEVAKRSTARIRERLAGEDVEPPTAQQVSRLALDGFRYVQQRRVDDRLRFLFGFGMDELNAGAYMRGDRQVPIKDEKVLSRAMEIVKQKENLGFNQFSPANEACLIGIDRQHGFEAFCIKAADGVLSFQSCGFEALGNGRYAAAERFAKALNERWLDSRREGPGPERGLWLLLEATLEAHQHYGQVGGNVRLILLDAREERPERRRREVADERARLAMELVRGGTAGMIAVDEARRLLAQMAFEDRDWEEVEAEMFRVASKPERLDTLLRSYKFDEKDGMPKMRNLDTLYAGGSK